MSFRLVISWFWSNVQSRIFKQQFGPTQDNCHPHFFVSLLSIWSRAIYFLRSPKKVFCGSCSRGILKKKKKKCLENLPPGNISHYLHITPENISYKLHPLTPWKSFPPPTPSWNFITAFSSPGIFLAHIHLNEFSLSPNSLKLFPTWENFRNFSRQQNPLVFFSAPTPVFLLFPICPADFSHTQIKLHIYLLHQYLREYFSQQL